MPELTTEQADELADQALGLKKAVGEFRNRFFDTLTPEQREGLRVLASELGDEVDHLTAMAIKATVAELQQTLAHLREVTNGVNHAVEHLSEVRKIVTVAAALVDLGAALAAANPGSALAALSDTVTALQA